jgi:hypothetical protein
LTQDTTASLESFFSSLSEANQQWMQQFVNSMTAGMPLDAAANPISGAWNQMVSNTNQMLAMQTNLYQQQMNMWLQFLGQAGRSCSTGSRNRPPLCRTGMERAPVLQLPETKLSANIQVDDRAGRSIPAGR